MLYVSRCPAASLILRMEAGGAGPEQEQEREEEDEGRQEILLGWHPKQEVRR